MKESSVPLCAVCKKPVDRFERSFSVLTQCYTFVAECHGQRQEVMLGAIQLAIDPYPEMIEAFKFKAIAP